MRLELPAEAIEFGSTAEKAFAGLGGVDMARQAEAEPARRRDQVAGAIDELGVADLDPRADLDTAAAAGELCRVAGRIALPYPIVPVLLITAGARLPLALVPDPARARVDHGDLFEHWRVATTGGWAATASPDRAPLASKLGPFVCDLAVTATPAAVETLDIDLHLTLTAWRILGTAERAVELAVEHVRGRHQFGQALAAFQAVQFQLADAAVAVDGLRELCRFTLWRLWAATARPDALALRLHALDTARAVLRTCQQLHGAAGVCDEYDISILARHGQPDLRLPFGAERAAAELVAAVEAHGFDSLFSRGSGVTTLEGPPLADAPGIGSLTMGGFITEVGTRFGPNEALVFDDPLAGGTTMRWTYADLETKCRRVASALVAAGIGKGGRVGILMGNRPEAVAALFGAGLAGAVGVPLSTFSTKAELAYLLAHADIEVLLTQTVMLGHLFVEEVESLTDAAPAQFPYLRKVAAVGLDWEDFLESGDRIDGELIDARTAHVTPADHGLIIYSSGTTDRPKGMLHVHRAPTLQFWLEAQVFGRHQKTRMWTALPMFWTAGLNTAMGATLAAGGCWVMQESFEAGGALQLMARERVTEPYTLPHQTAALEEHPDWLTTDLSSLRCVYGKSAFARHPSVTGDPGWNMPVAYGLSETCSGFASHYSSAAREELKASSGRLLPGNRLRVVDPETGQALGPGENGELAIFGPTLMDRYVKVDREKCFDGDGFFHTGDAGYFDEDAFVHWTGRRTEMIKTGGANVSPAELEVALRACPPVKLARVVGVPDRRLGQAVALCAVLKEGADATADDVRRFLQERVAAYKVPKYVLLFADGEIPMTSSDTKVRDRELEQLVLDRLAGTDSGVNEGSRS